MRADPSSVSLAHYSRHVLDAGWAFARLAPGLATTPEALIDALADQGASITWHGAPHATTAAAALRAANAWSLADPLDFDAWDWWFRCQFAAPETASTAAHDVVAQILTLGGLATLADVWLNGAHLLHSDNMYLAHEVDVSTVLQADNTLYIRCASLNAALRAPRPRPAWRTRLIAQQQLRWFRTTFLGRMPGWSSTPQAVGPWRDVTLETRTMVAVVSSDLRTRVDGDDGVIDLTLQLRTAAGRTVTGATVSVQQIVDSGPTSTTQSLTCAADTNGAVISGTIRIPDVAPWWPHTHGAQPRYAVAIALQIGDTTATIHCHPVAFRTITLDTSDGNFAIAVNGIPVFCRGACWSTVDPLRLTGTHEAYREALTLARDGGMNMLRVGGTMTYEADAFYELCDELGILVWQDFMFANLDYPFGDDAFATSVRDEAQQFLRRTQQRACLAVLCGNSEIEQQVSMLGLPKERWSSPFFQETLPALCRTLRPDVAYWPSSPSGGAFPFHVDAGDAHYFGFGPYLRPFDDVRTSGVRFASETLAFAHVPDQETIDLLPCGTNGAGHHPAWKAGVPRDNGATWDFEDVRDQYVEQFFNVNARTLRYGDIERYVALGRVTSGEAIARAIGEWRRPTSSCNGALLWLYRDVRPGAGWGVIDSTGRPKAAYYYFRRACAPAAIAIADQGLNGLTMTAINDTAATIDAELSLRLFRHGEVLVASADVTRTLAPHSAVDVHADLLLDGFVDLSYAYRFGPPNHDLVVATLVDRSSGATLGESFFFPVGLPNTRETDLGLDASLTAAADGRYCLRLRTRRFAQSIAVQVDGYRPHDNYFHLAPGADIEVVLHPLTSGREPSGVVHPLNAVTPTRITRA